jgi:hypothetical protein
VPASFIHDVPVLGDAAHEISHALGLSQRDTDPSFTFSTGHTSPLNATKAEGNFSCGNVMWEGTHFLKDELSPGQAFWMSQSCTSFVGRNSACLACSDKSGGASPCPLFSLGHVSADPSRCVSNTVVVDKTKILVPRRQNEKAAVSCDLPNTTYIDGRKLEADLTARYTALQEHVKGRSDLHLGAINKRQFLENWENQLALNLAGNPDGTAAGAPKAKIIVPPRISFRLEDKVKEIVEHRVPTPPVCPPPSGNK